MFYDDLVCMRCGRPAMASWKFDECPYCREEGVFANYTAPVSLSAGEKESIPVNRGQPGIWKYRRLYPVRRETVPVSIEEGGTPLVELDVLGRQWGVTALYAKDESRNPTWSHKDRLTTVGVTKAKEVGAPGIIVSSTGNQGLSAAAYAAKAGLPCIVLTGTSTPAAVKTLMRAYGAMVFALPTGKERVSLVETCVRELGWFPLTGFGTEGNKGANPYAIDGYKSLAIELYTDLGRVPDNLIFSVAGGDSMVGTWKGFQDLFSMGILSKMPRMIAAEPLGSLAMSVAVKSEIPVAAPLRDTVAFAVGAPEGTYQALKTIYDSKGTAVEVDDEAIMDAQVDLAAKEGLFVEPSSAVAAAAAKRLLEWGEIKTDETTILVLTSSGLKETGSAARRMPETPVIESSLMALKQGLSVCYGFSV